MIDDETNFIAKALIKFVKLLQVECRAPPSFPPSLPPLTCVRSWGVDRAADG
jgi:hypothetical protein